MKRLLLLAVVAAAAVLLALQLANRKEKNDKAAEQAGLIFGINQSEIQQIVLYRKQRNDPVVRFARLNGDWYIEEPEHYPAAGYTVDAIAREAATLKSKRSFNPADSGQTMDNFGVTSPSYRVTLYTADTTRTVAIGDKMPIGDSVFVRAGTDPVVHLTERGLDAYLDKPISEFRRRDLFWQFPPAVSTVELAFASSMTLFTHPATDSTPVWQFASGKLANSSKVEDVLRTLKNLSATGFSDLAEPFRLERAIRVESSQGPLTVQFARKDENSYLARIAGRPFLYQLNSFSIKQLFPSEAELLPPPPLSLPLVAEPVSAAAE